MAQRVLTIVASGSIPALPSRSLCELILQECRFGECICPKDILLDRFSVTFATFSSMGVLFRKWFGLKTRSRWLRKRFASAIYLFRRPPMTMFNRLSLD